jgi:hypothetical protein
LDHPAQHGARAQQRTLQIDFDRSPPLPGILFLGWSKRRPGAGVIDEQADWAELRFHSRNHGLDGRLIGDVRLDRDCRMPTGSNEPYGLFQLIPAARRYRHAHAGSGKGAGEDPAQSAPAAGD